MSIMTAKQENDLSFVDTANLKSASIQKLLMPTSLDLRIVLS